MTEYRISLAPSGGLRLHVSDRRFIDLPPTEAAMRHIVAMLKQAARGEAPQRGYIGQFPTQAIVNTWLRQDAARQRAVAKEETAVVASNLGIDLGKLEFTL